MPLIEYECPNCFSIIEKLYKLVEYPYPETIECLYCLGDNGGTVLASIIWSKPATNQIGKPTIVFTNPRTGESQIATSQYDSPPPGFVKEELKGSIERSKFEQQQNRINAEQDDIYNETIRQKREEFKKNHIDLINQHMSDDVASSDNPALAEGLMKKAIERIRKKPALKKKRRTEFTFDINHKDKSNLT